MPKVSVVMASYNHEKFVAETIQSVLDQTYQDFEFIITDDGSPDRTVDVIKRFDDPRIKLFSFPQNKGACTAMNNCINQAKGEYIAVINSDDSWLPNKLEKQVKFLDSHPEIGAVFSYAQIIDEKGQDFADDNNFYSKVFIQPNRTRFEWLNHFFFHGNCLCHPSLLIRHQCYQDVGLYDERFALLPDFDFWIRLCLQHEIHIIPENLVNFRILPKKINASGDRPETKMRHGLEFTQILKHYISSGVLDNFLKVFPIGASISTIDIPFRMAEVDKKLAPFIVALYASKHSNPAHQFFCFDVLYQMYSDQEIANQLKEKYTFDFPNLIELAGRYDVFNIVELEKTQHELHQTRIELLQYKNRYQETKDDLDELFETKSELKRVRSQLEETQLKLIEYQGVEELLIESQSQLSQTQNLLTTSQIQLNQRQHDLSKFEDVLQEKESSYLKLKTELEVTQKSLIKSQRELCEKEAKNRKHRSQLEQMWDELTTSRIELEQYSENSHYLQQELEENKKDLGQARKDLVNSQRQLYDKQVIERKIRSELVEVWDELADSQSCLQQTEELLSESMSQLHQTEEVLLSCQKQLQEVQNKLVTSEVTLHDKETALIKLETELQRSKQNLVSYQKQFYAERVALRQANSQLCQLWDELLASQSELKQKEQILSSSQLQLKLTEETLIASQNHLQLMEETLVQAQSQLQLMEKNLLASESQLQLIKKESLLTSESQLFQYQSQLQQNEAALSEYQSKLQETEAAFLSSQAELYKYQTELMELRSEFLKVQEELQQNQQELERYKFLQTVSQLEKADIVDYNTLVWDGWLAYQNGDLSKMQQCLQQSLQFTSLSSSQTIIDWIESFSKFSTQKGKWFDATSLTATVEWQKLTRQIFSSKIGIK